MLTNRHFFPTIVTIIAFLLSTTDLNAQSNADGSNLYIIGSLIIVGALILISAILTLSENLIQIEANNAGVSAKQEGFSLFSTPRKLFGKVAPSYTKGLPLINLSKGYDILLTGSADKTIVEGKAQRFAVQPTDFRGISPIPKVTVEVGDEVKAGDVLFYDKKNPSVKYVSPVSGEVVEIKRGEKRAITAVVILADKEIKYRLIDLPSLATASREELVDFLQANGAWTLFNERPFDILPAKDSIPANIFISTFDTAPLAPDYNLVVDTNPEAFQKGLDLLAKLTPGKVFLGLNANGDKASHSAFVNATGVEKTWFAGKHPSGNVGVQIHHTAPIKGADKVWTLGVQEVMTLGDLIFKGIYNAQRIVAVGGSEIKNPTHVKTYLGASVDELLKGQLNEGKTRTIIGDVLSGTKAEEGDFLGYHADQVSVIQEGDYYEIFGWLLPLKPRPTISKTFPNFLYSDLEYEGDTNTHGEKRAFVMSGQYEEVMPMKIYPQHLMKAIMTGDLEQMEGLGINELSEEDVALCEFVCTSKMPLQSILRDGLDMLREQS
jgi:Na+-transporting NADH:ubiquinone oxidoreductase subunit A